MTRSGSTFKQGRDAIGFDTHVETVATLTQGLAR